MQRLVIGSVPIDIVTFTEALDRIEALVARREGGSVFTPNVDHVVNAERDEALRLAYADASLSVVDGMPLVWGSRLLGTPLPERISGADLVWPLLERAARRGWRVYLLGGAPGVADTAAEVIREELGVQVAGIDVPTISLSVPDEAPVTRIRAARPDIVLVALGSPKQEIWIHRHLEALRPAVAVGVGASLDFVAGTARRAPRWMSRAGFEWLHRLAQEPCRLWRRYLVNDPRFLVVLLRTWRATRGGRRAP